MDNNYDKLKENLKKEILEELREDEPEVAGEDYEPLKLSHGQKFLKGFDYAYEGLVYAINHEKNMKFHFLASILVLVASLFFSLSRIEMMFLVFAVVFVISLELMNTAPVSYTHLTLPTICSV